MKKTLINYFFGNVVFFSLVLAITDCLTDGLDFSARNVAIAAPIVLIVAAICTLVKYLELKKKNNS